MRRHPFFFAAICFALLSSPLSANDAGEDTRQIEVKRMAFSVTIPTGWQVKLNERLKMFLVLQETTEDGKVLPTSVNYQYRKAADKPFPPIPEAEAYSEIIKATMKQQMPDMEILSAQVFEHEGYKGVKVEFQATQQGLLLRMNHYNLVHPDGQDSFIITAGSLDRLWEDAEPKLERIVASTSLSIEQDD